MSVRSARSGPACSAADSWFAPRLRGAVEVGTDSSPNLERRRSTDCADIVGGAGAPRCVVHALTVAVDSRSDVATVGRPHPPHPVPQGSRRAPPRPVRTRFGRRRSGCRTGWAPRRIGRRGSWSRGYRRLWRRGGMRAAQGIPRGLDQRTTLPADGPALGARMDPLSARGTTSRRARQHGRLSPRLAAARGSDFTRLEAPPPGRFSSPAARVRMPRRARRLREWWP